MKGSDFNRNTSAEVKNGRNEKQEGWRNRREREISSMTPLSETKHTAWSPSHKHHWHLRTHTRTLEHPHTPPRTHTYAHTLSHGHTLMCAHTSTWFTWTNIHTERKRDKIKQSLNQPVVNPGTKKNNKDKNLEKKVFNYFIFSTPAIKIWSES